MAPEYSSAGTTACVGTWQAWTNTSASTTNTEFWVNCNGTASGTPTNVKVTEETPGEREARLAEARAVAKKQLEAEGRAETLFKEIVGLPAYELFQKRGYHEVLTHSGKRCRLRRRQEIEVMRGLTEEREYTLCIHPADRSLPPMDTLIVQLFLILSGEEGEKLLLSTANRHPRLAA